MTTYEVTSLCSLSDLSSSISSCSSSRMFAKAVALGVSMACRRNSTVHATVTRKFPLTPLGCVSLHHSCCASTVSAHNKPKACLNLDCCYETLAEVKIKGKRNSISYSIAYVATLQPLAYQCSLRIQLQICCCKHCKQFISKPFALPQYSPKFIAHLGKNTPRSATTVLAA